MSTTGEGTGRDRRRVWFAFLGAMLFTVALAAGLGHAGDSLALTPPPADQAEIVYSNGGRLLKVNADGTDRKVLTRRGEVRTPGVNGGMGDRFPHVSPDGTRVLFTRHTGSFAPDNEFLFSGQNMLLNLGTGKAREVLPGTERVTYENLAWLPGTDRILASKTVSGAVRKRSVVSVRLDGSGEQTILRFRGYRGGFPKLNLNFEAARLDASPDGSAFLMTRMDSWSEYGYTLELVDVATGKRKVIAKKAHSGSWSPDGERIVFVKDRPKTEVCGWDFDCTPSGDLYLADGDGANLHRLTNTRRDEENPSWSPDGSRIAFSGTIGRPDDRSTSELLSLRADGKCLAGLTNGSPASLDPDFVADSGTLQGPGTCGLTERPALAETHLNPRMNKGFGRRLWLGPDSSQGLLSFDADIGFLSFAVYGDCGTLGARCPTGTTVGTLPVCGMVGNWAEMIAGLPSLGQKRRGVWLAGAARGKSSSLMVFSGPQITMIEDRTSSRDTKTKPLTRREQLALVDELRPVGKKLEPKLPRLLLPRLDFRVARLVTRYVRRHSVAETIRDFKMTRRKVIAQLRFRQNVKLLGAGRTKCPSSVVM